MVKLILLIHLHFNPVIKLHPDEGAKFISTSTKYQLDLRTMRYRRTAFRLTDPHERPQKNCMKRGHPTDTQTNTHRNSMKSSAQRADALKRDNNSRMR